MKKRILGVAFGAAVLFSTGTTSITTITEAEAGPTITCSSGDLYTCYTFFGGGVVKKGRGDTTIEQHH